MKKSITIIMMLLFAVCVNGQVSNKEAARMLCESVPFEKYDKKVCENITVRINEKKVGKDGMKDVVRFFKEKGINCKFQSGTPTSEEEQKHAVIIFTPSRFEHKLYVHELDNRYLMGSFNIIYSRLLNNCWY